MTKLIISAFSRLMKNITFWMLLILLALYGILTVSTASSELTDVYTSFPLERYLFEFVPIMALVTAILVSLFVGAEYSDGTIRNKLVIGYRRSAIYLANLVVCSLGGALISAAYFVVAVLVGKAKGGIFTVETNRVLFYVLCSFMAVIAFTSLMTALAMSNHNKAGNVVVSMVLAIILFASGSFIHQRLQAPKMYDHYLSVNSAGVPTQVEQAPNPLYVDGTQRVVFELLDDCLPSGQAMQIVGAFDDRGNALKTDYLPPYKLPLYSILLTAASAALGISIFKRKEIK